MKEILNLGSVFLQKDKNAIPLMVIGYLPIHPDTNEMYDYLTVMYPQGWLSNNSLLMIDHGEVGEVLYDGYSDSSTEALLNKIAEFSKEKDF
jgi:hypothetical protein